ncbi:UNVERIFIED_ORG: hypothetical protein GGE64_003075 [Rhizobium etli]|uniref:DUF7256 domain-containing protein n=1 Tax=unclassified Rhizobium TaxID=2613769 RepID=UPI00098FDD4E|nr:MULTISPECIES: hypothetical protein [Rhizobium]ARQ59252.1 hypothetical protein Kim5_CH03222 [Rhizobium sp. Kim5]RSB91833.1 hypothetical protein EFR00_25260 [Rhizobium sophoriradicis]
MPIDNARLAPMQPGVSVEELKAALGTSWQEPGVQAEGYLHIEEFGTRITADGRLGEVHFRAPFELPPIHGVRMGMPAEELHRLYPVAERISDEREKYGWTMLKMNLSDTLMLGVGIREEVVRIISLTDPTAVYPERPYKYADPNLTEAYDLTMTDPVDLARRPESGWCYGRPPGIDARIWPVSTTNGLPLRHAFTVKLPPQYRTLGDNYVAISLFVDEQWETLPARENVAGGARHADPRRFDIKYMDNEYVLFWLTEEEFAAPLGVPPTIEGAPVPGWLSKSPLEYFGEFNLPRTVAEQQAKNVFSPGGLAVNELLAATRPQDGWKNLPGREALDYGWPIEITLREGDPNIGKPAREFRHQNELSGYIVAYSEEGQEQGLERFLDWQAHLGGTMFPMQGYPDFSPYYIEISEIFGGFNFGNGVAQIDLKEMKLEWAC